MIRALWHAHRTGHAVRREERLWSGDRTWLWLCDDCGHEFWPFTKQGPYPDWRDNPVDRRKR